MWRLCCPYLFIFSPRKGCFVIVAFSGYLHLYFMLSFSHENQASTVGVFNSTSRYLDDLRNIDMNILNKRLIQLIQKNFIYLFRRQISDDMNFVVCFFLNKLPLGKKFICKVDRLNVKQCRSR